MTLQGLLGEMPKQEFVAEYLHRLPLSRAGSAAAMEQFGTWDVLGRILSQEGVDAMVVRGGQRYPGPDPGCVEEARRLSDEGYTLLVRHAEQHEPGLGRLAKSFERDFHAPVNIHIYATPAGEHGFSWHYDAEDVFIIQTSGVKEYCLRKNTVQPWPLVETIPDDMRYEREIMPMLRVALHAGDWLYVPCGYWHKAAASLSGETAISLAIGVMSRAALDVYDFLRARLARSLLWRQRLPVTGDASPLDDAQLQAQHRELFDLLAEDLRKQMSGEGVVAEYLQWARDRAGDA